MQALDELQQRLDAIASLLAKAEALTAQVESGQKPLLVLSSARAHIEAAHKLATLPELGGGGQERA